MEKTLVETVQGFDIYFTPLVEYDTLESLYPDDTPAQIKEAAEKLERYEAVLFCAQVTAHKAGVELSSDYLGACHYDSYEDFYIKYKGDYYAGMVDTVISEAKQKIKELNT